MERMRTYILILVLGSGICFLPVSRTWAQDGRSPVDTILVGGYISGQDTLPLIALPELLVQAPMLRRFRRRWEEWNRLRNAVYITYPYAVQASFILRQVDLQLSSLPAGRERKQFLAHTEDRLKSQFGNKLENLSVFQGKILLKLISRQTGSDCYDIIRQLRGGFSARFWQTLSFFFGENLKTDYDAQQDRDIEVIVQEIQHNQGVYN